MTKSIAELRTMGVVLDADEAIAIAQQLLTSLGARRASDETAPPDDSPATPSVENVHLKADGSVVCLGCSSTPAASELGTFLDALLPAGSPGVPGAVRYTIARALHDVDAPPYDSLGDLSRDLARHEHGDRAGHVRRALARADRQDAIVPAVVPVALADRRRSRPSATTALRRELREADARLYQRHEQQRHEQKAPLPVIDLVAAAPPQPARTLSAAAVCLAAGLSLIGAGELMHRRHTTAVAAAPAPAAQQAIADDQPGIEPSVAIAGPERGIIAVRDVALPPARRPRPDARRASFKRPPRAAAMAAHRQEGSRPQSRHVLDRLRLGWLRTAFSAHSDL